MVTSRIESVYSRHTDSVDAVHRTCQGCDLHSQRFAADVPAKRLRLAEGHSSGVELVSSKSSEGYRASITCMSAIHGRSHPNRRQYACSISNGGSGYQKRTESWTATALTHHDSRHRDARVVVSHGQRGSLREAPLGRWRIARRLPRSWHRRAAPYAHVGQPAPRGTDPNAVPVGLSSFIVVWTLNAASLASQWRIRRKRAL